MAYEPKRSKIQRERDRVTMAELHLKGWTMARIGEYLELHESTVSRELKKVKQAWKAESVRDYDLHVVEELRRLAMVEAVSWANQTFLLEPTAELMILVWAELAGFGRT